MAEPIGFAGKYLVWRKKMFENYPDYIKHLWYMNWDNDLNTQMENTIIFIEVMLHTLFGTTIYIVLSILLFIPDWIIKSYFDYPNILIFPAKFIINLFVSVFALPFTIIYGLAMFLMGFVLLFVLLCILKPYEWAMKKDDVTPIPPQNPAPELYSIERHNTVVREPDIERNIGKIECNICNEKKTRVYLLECSHQLCESCYKNLPTKNCPYCRAELK